jgi:hypothetical protein
MKIWISKYALSDGITEHECDSPDEGSDRVCPGAPFMSFASFKLGRDAHTSRDEAVKAAESARKKKLASVRKQIARLEAMVF